MLVALYQFNKEDLLAGLLLFRLLYYIVPFVLSLFILGIRETLLGRSARRFARVASPPIAGAGEYVRQQSDVS
jgi:glycosyltransferase 2 family protein